MIICHFLPFFLSAHPRHCLIFPEEPESLTPHFANPLTSLLQNTHIGPSWSAGPWTKQARYNTETNQDLSCLVPCQRNTVYFYNITIQIGQNWIPWEVKIHSSLPSYGGRGMNCEHMFCMPKVSAQVLCNSSGKKEEVPFSHTLTSATAYQKIILLKPSKGAELYMSSCVLAQLPFAGGGCAGELLCKSVAYGLDLPMTHSWSSWDTSSGWIQKRLPVHTCYEIGQSPRTWWDLFVVWDFLYIHRYLRLRI